MTLLEAIQSRHSVRKYVEKHVDDEQVRILQAKVEELNAAGHLHIQLVTNEPRAFKGRMAYGVFSGVSSYFAMVGPKADIPGQPTLPERIGYYGEQLVLLAQQLGLNTCWVGLTYNKIKEAYTIGEGEKLCCMIALGYGADQGRTHKVKSPEDVSNVDSRTPQWFADGVAAALKAPTAVNQQKFRFEYLEPEPDARPRVKATSAASMLGYTKIDLGIAKCHFEIGAGPDHFDWAN